MAHPYSDHSGYRCQWPPLGQCLGFSGSMRQEGLLLLLQPQVWALWSPHPREPSTAGLEGTLAGVFSALWDFPMLVETRKRATLDVWKYLHHLEVKLCFYSFRMYYSCAVVNLGVVRPNTGLLLRVCWLSCLFTSVHLTAALTKPSFLQSSSNSLLSRKDTHVYRRCYYVPARK